MTEVPLPDYALPQGAIKKLKPFGYGQSSLSKNTILRCINCPRRETPAYGLDIMNCTDLPGGAVYPLLKGFKNRGLLESEEEAINPQQARRPRRVFYRVLPSAKQALGETPPLSSCQMLQRR